MADEPQQPTTNDQQPTTNQPKPFNWKVFLASGGCGVIIASLILLPLLGLGIYYLYQHGLPALYGGQGGECSVTSSLDLSTAVPETIKMTITAYYSPLPGQQKYETGSYESEIRLEGQGTHTAMGLPPNWGTVAAPPEYDFGIVMDVPGYTKGVVMDRGGAINGNHIDIWMGKGDEGREKAVAWGSKNDIEVTVYRWPNLSKDQLKRAIRLTDCKQVDGGGGGDYLPGSGGWHWPLKIPLTPNPPRRNHYCFFDTSYADCADYGRGEGGSAHDPIFAMGNGRIQFQRYGVYPEDPYLYRTSPQNGNKKAGYNAWFYSSDGKIKAFYAHIYKAGISLNADLSKSIPVNGGDQFAEVYAGGMLSPHLHFQFKYNGSWVKSINQPSVIQSLINTNQQ